MEYSDSIQEFFQSRHIRVIFMVDSYNQCGNTKYFSTKESAEEFVSFQSKFDIHCSIYELEVFD